MMVRQPTWQIAIAALVFLASLDPLANRPVSAQAPVAAPAPRVAEPFPDAATIASRKLAAEQRPLFATHEPLSFTLTADFKVVQADRRLTSTTTYPATLVVMRADGTEASLPVRIRTRGHSRRKPTMCDFAPLRIELESNPVGTPFEGQKTLKLGTHCRDTAEYEEYVFREHAVYRLHNIVTTQSFRSRLATARYVNAKNNKTIGTFPAHFLEDEGDVAARLSGVKHEQYRLTFRQSEPRSTLMLGFFEFMIGNTDMSMSGLHNIILVKTADTIIPVAYDFDYSGVVAARYARADPRLKIRTVRERVYRGPCGSTGELSEFVAHFRARRAELTAVYDALPKLSRLYANQAKDYLGEFFKLIDDSAKFQPLIAKACVAGM